MAIGIHLVVPSAQALDLLVTSEGTNQVLRYDGTTGAFIDVFVPPGSGGLRVATGAIFGADGRLYVSSVFTNSVLRYDGKTGAFFDVFVPPGSGGLALPTVLVFGPDGNLYVCPQDNDSVLRYDGQTGAFIDAFVPAGSGGLNGPHGLVFGPDGNLYASSHLSNSPTSQNSVLRYDGTTGAFIDVFASTGLSIPLGVVFGPDGNLYVGVRGCCAGTTPSNSTVLRYDGTTGAFIDAFVPPDSGGLLNPNGLVFGPDGNLYVVDSNPDNGQVLRYDGTTGAFIDAFVPPGSGGLFLPVALAFTPSGPLEEVLNAELSGTPDPATFAFDPTPVQDGPAGTFSFTAAFCNIGAKQLILLKSVTIMLTGGNVLLNRDSGTPPGVGSERRFPAMQGFADGVLSGGECVDVPYRIGLAETPFEFLVNGVGVALPAGGFMPLNIVGSPNALSADGAVIVGQFVPAVGVHAFRWTAAGGQGDLGVLLDFDFSGATSVSADGSVVVGFSGDHHFSIMSQPARWTAHTQWVRLEPMPPGFFSGQANDVSADGTVVVGTVRGADLPGGVISSKPFRWTAATGIIPLGTLGGPQTTGQAVSADGAVVVGFSNFGTFPTHIEAFRWSAQTGMVGLGAVPGFSNSVANDVSADGSVVVGTSAVNGEKAPAFRWTEQGGMVSLDDFPGGRFTSALAVSADGSVVVGVGRDPVGPFHQEFVFIWDAVHGMRALRDVLLEQGADVSGWRLLLPFGMSADGRVIGGLGINPSGARQPWLARLAETPKTRSVMSEGGR